MKTGIWGAGNIAHTHAEALKASGVEIAAVVDVDEAKAKDLMVKTDKRRSSYYNYYSNKKWGDPKSYDMCINSSVVGPEGAVDLIMELAKKKQEWNKKK